MPLGQMSLGFTHVPNGTTKITWTAARRAVTLATAAVGAIAATAAKTDIAITAVQQLNPSNRISNCWSRSSSKSIATTKEA